MKKERLFTRFSGSLLTAVVTLLGFSSCESEDMYGTPYGEFEVTGLVADEDGNPLDKIRVISRTIQLDYDNGPGVINGFSVSGGCDTTYTDANGHYQLENKDAVGPPSFAMISAEDPDGVYDVSYQYVDLIYTGKHKDWYEGKAKATADFVLKKAENTEAE